MNMMLLLVVNVSGILKIGWIKKSSLRGLKDYLIIPKVIGTPHNDDS